MFCENCETELPENAKFCPECATPVPERIGLDVDQKVDTVKGTVTGLVAAEKATTTGLDADISQDIGAVESGSARSLDLGIARSESGAWKARGKCTP